MTEIDAIPEQWEDFESWIRAKVGGPFSWKIRPRDTTLNRKVVAESILETIEEHGGEFPPSGNLFLEREDNDHE